MAENKPPYTEFGQAPRLAARVFSQFMLRQWEIVSEQSGGDLHMAVVFMAIVAANVQHIGHTTEEGRQFSALDNAPPDGTRRPISTHALAHSLGLPYETTRRNVNKLMAHGVVERVPGQGLVVPTSYLQSPQNISHLLQQVASLQWLLASLKRAGFDLNALADGGQNIPPPAGIRWPPPGAETRDD